jgi:hypothetical protein
MPHDAADVSDREDATPSARGCPVQMDPKLEEQKPAPAFCPQERVMIEVLVHFSCRCRCYALLRSGSASIQKQWGRTCLWTGRETVQSFAQE